MLAKKFIVDVQLGFWISLNKNLLLRFFRKTKFIESWLIFHQKKNKIWSVHVKYKPCNSLEGHQLYQKCTLQHRYFPANIPNLLGNNLFYGTTMVAVFELRVNVRKEFKKKKLVERYQSLKAGQLPREHLSVVYLWILLSQNI